MSTVNSDQGATDDVNQIMTTENGDQGATTDDAQNKTTENGDQDAMPEETNSSSGSSLSTKDLDLPYKKKKTHRGKRGGNKAPRKKPQFDEWEDAPYKSAPPRYRGPLGLRAEIDASDSGPLTRYFMSKRGLSNQSHSEGQNDCLVCGDIAANPERRKSNTYRTWRSQIEGTAFTRRQVCGMCMFEVRELAVKDHDAAVPTLTKNVAHLEEEINKLKERVDRCV